jgi:uncharacterized protein YecT (DUF1311 family)
LPAHAAQKRYHAIGRNQPALRGAVNHSCEELIEMTTATTVRTGPAMHRTKGILIAFGLLLSTVPLAAADNEMSKEYLACMDRSNGVTSEMLDCISAEFTCQDARLNENYKTLMSKLSAKRKEGLLEAQRAWIKFKDANCSFYYDPEGGSAAHLSSNGCVLNTTADRATELKNLTKDE